MNVLIVSFDTTRADHLGCYGDEGASTPVLDSLAEQGVLFEQAIAPVPITLPSHSSLMTGKVPFAHGVRDNGIFVLNDEQLTLAEILRDAGYRTAAAVGSYPLIADTGIAQGFEFFDDHLTSNYEDVYGDRIFPKERLFFDERKAARVNEALFPWLQQHHQEPFFVWAHYFDPHHPHDPPPPFNQRFVHDLYRGEIAFADESLGMLLAQLERLGVAGNTMVIVTSDHGEGLGEHNEATHSLLAYQSTLHVPLIMKIPGINGGRRVEERVSLIDILPTILDFNAIPHPPGIQGRSLLGLAQGTDEQTDQERQQYAETLSPRLSRGWSELRVMFDGRMKYIHGSRPQLFDLETDPGELHDLSAERAKDTSALRTALELYLQEHEVDDLDASVTLDENTARRLEALGYLHGSGDEVGPIEEVLRSDGDAPRDHAGTVSAYSHARQLLFQGRAVDAMPFIQDLLGADPQNPEYLELLAQSQLQIGQVNEALNNLKALSRSDSRHNAPESMARMVAGIYFSSGDLTSAYGWYRDAEAVQETAAGQYRLAKIHELQGELEEQVLYLGRALELEVDFVPARVDLAVWFARNDDPDEAVRQFERALADHPYNERSYYNYGVFQLQYGNQPRAISLIKRAAELKPNYLQAHYALVEMLLATGDREGALDHQSTLEQLAPQSHEAIMARTLLEQPS